MSNRVRWLLIIVPALIVGAIEIVSDELLDEAFPFPLDTLLVVAVTLVLGGVLATLAFRRIDALTGALRRRNEELEARETSARALHRVSVAIASLADIERVLDAIVTHTRELLDVDAVVLLLAGPDGRLARRAASAIPGALVATPSIPGTNTGDAPEATTADEILRFVVPSSAVARLAAPLQRGGRTIGLLAVGAAEARSFDADALETLSSLANQATIALENARLEARLRELAVVGERERIARELHDGLSQVLGYVNTKSQAVDGFLAAGRVDDARAQLGELSAAARSVYVDVRETILGLRSPVGPAAGLVAAIRAHATGVAASARLAIRVHAAPEVESARLDPNVETQAFRIVAEALTNVRKHAGARRVTVDLRTADDRLTVTVRDDGRGFVPGGPQDGRPHYGLRSMTERASGIGGTLAWENDQDGGAIVRLVAPFRPLVDAAPEPAPDPAPEPGRPGADQRLMRILLADDHALFRDGVASLLAAWGHVVVGFAADGDGAVELADRLRPDLVLMDVRMPGCGGIEATVRLAALHPEIPIVMLTASEDEDDLFTAIKAGARGYLLKDLEAPQLRAMLAGVERGEVAISPVTAARILTEVARPTTRSAGVGGGGASTEPDHLTEREVEVLRLVVAGLRNKEIAAELGISENTTKFHLRNILEKLHASSRTEVAARAIREGLVPDG